MVSKKNASRTQVLWCTFKQLLLVTRISRIWKRGIHGLFNSFEYKKLSLYSHTVEISTHTINFMIKEENVQEVSAHLASGLSVWVLLQVTDVKYGPLTFIHLDFDFKISLLMVQGRLKSLTLVSCYRLIFTWGLARPRKVINIVSFASGRLRKRERKKNRHQIRQWAYWGHIYVTGQN